ncbi:DNA repair helicase XPB [Brevibacillus massiliensis]|uniref:DNA repair helicase XPB n=1 Tax=Brevibacillus massiliensis TaxID=1118054 RepID=UPI0002D928E7|nr:DNA repair helicase XPB [Brevibacillus massiliensis]
MSVKPHLPLIVQSDRTILLEVHNPLFDEARHALAGFAELVKSPEYIHTYRITPLSLWNAASSGITAEDVLASLEAYSKFGIPPTIAAQVRETFARCGLLRMERRGDDLVLVGDDPLLMTDIMGYRSFQAYIDTVLSPTEYRLRDFARGPMKQELVKLGYPVQDLAGYAEGEGCPVELRQTTLAGRPFGLRPYQQSAVDAFYQSGSVYGGSGVLVLPCGAGKTIIGLGAINQIKRATLILTTNTTSVRQWISEILDKTTVESEMVGEYTGQLKQVKPITVATYQILTHHHKETDEYPHLRLFSERDWGLIIYDEVHLLPAPIFRMTASLQARRRLGLTATLIREDGREEDVFSLIGPKKFELPWRDLEDAGWIAQANCQEIRLSISPKLREAYAVATPQQKHRIAAENPQKVQVLKSLLARHQSDRVLIIGQYIKQLESIAEQLGAPLITGKVPERERKLLYQQFKSGKINHLIVSKVANFAVDLPDANVAIQVSGTFGSRQEEAQRLGRILRPKEGDNQAHFYTLVTRDTREQEFAAHRQLFLIEQGYRYEVVDMDPARFTQEHETYE